MQLHQVKLKHLQLSGQSLTATGPQMQSKPLAIRLETPRCEDETHRFTSTLHS